MKSAFESIGGAWRGGAALALGATLLGALAGPASAAPEAAVAAQPSAAPDDDAALEKALVTLDWAAEEPKVPQALAARIKDSEALQQAALKHYRSLPAGPARFNVLEFLASAAGPRLAAIGRTWAQNAASADDRLSGFELISRAPATPETVALALEALRTERDPGVLAAAIACAARTDVPPPEQARTATARLHALVTHPAPNVRSSAIQRLADWDRNFRYIEADLLRAMHDPDADVRTAAAGAVSITRATSQRMKRRLLQMATDPHEDANVRWVAQMNLQHFDLEAREHTAYLRAIGTQR